MTMHAASVVDDGDGIIKERLSWFQLTRLTVIFLGVQVGWAIEIAFTTPIFLVLGLSHTEISFLWMAGPISGMIGQPLVGAISDGWYTRFGRRIPFIFIGGVGILLGMFMISYAQLIGHSHGAAVAVAIVGFWVLDFANNAVQGPVRALLVDIAPPDQQQAGSSLFSVMIGAGNLIGYFVGSLPLLNIVPFMETQYRALFTFAMILLSVCLFITLTGVKEPVRVAKGIKNPFKETLIGLRQMPPPVKRVCIVQFVSWIGWFCYILFITDWMGEVIYGGDPYAPTGSDKLKAFNNGVRHGALALCFNAMVTIAVSAVIPKIVSYVGYKPVYFISQIIFAVCMISTWWIRTSFWGMFVITACGIPWSATMVLPFSIVGESVTSGSSSGMYMGVLNIFVVIPQLLVSAMIPIVINLSHHNVTSALVTGGVTSVIAAFCTLFLIAPTPTVTQMTTVQEKEPLLVNRGDA